MLHRGHMKRRQCLLIGAGTVSIAGCTAGGDSISVELTNESGSSHSVKVWLTRQEDLVISETVQIEPEASVKLGETAWREGRYRVAVRLDGDPALVKTFESDNSFNFLGISIDSENSVSIDRYNFV